MGTAHALWRGWGQGGPVDLDSICVTLDKLLTFSEASGFYR